jgi:hypothetical protein
LSKCAYEGCSEGLARFQIGNSIVNLLNTMEAGKGTSTSGSIDKHGLAELEFAIGFNADIGFHGFTLK